MRWMKWAGLLAAILMIVSCMLPWVTIPSRNIVISGVEALHTDFGKPGYLHLLLTAFFLLFNFTPRIWAKRSNLAVTALNMAWAIRNYFIIAACREGDCPEKHIAIYLVLIAAFLMLIAALFPDIALPDDDLERRNGNKE
jgi:hypothetical protein